MIFGDMDKGDSKEIASSFGPVHVEKSPPPERSFHTFVYKRMRTQVYTRNRKVSSGVGGGWWQGNLGWRVTSMEGRVTREGGQLVPCKQFG